MYHFTLRQLSYVCAVADQGGIAQAARHLNISQPSVAQALDKLEDSTGLVLFQRHHARGATLTRQGRRFLRSAEELLRHADRVANESAAIAARSAGEIRLGCFTTIASFHFPGLVQSFRHDRPEIRIVPSEATLDALPRRVADGELDICITYAFGMPDPSLSVHHLFSIRPAVILPAGHRYAEKRTLTLTDLSSEPYVLYDAPGSREYFTGLLAQAGLAPEISYTSHSLEGVRSAVAAGFGFSIIAFCLPGAESYGGLPLATKSLKGSLPDLDVVLMTRREDEDDPLIEAFLEYAKSHFGNQSPLSKGVVRTRR